ncbi:protein CANDIDATE G-PROTEIN COUPLED RECEPTOR 7-like [Andrographis paniculata]|uniref:protein CANDIDATE G-PROTEIN COUPLED RECEPTOR 7-like n=1 Tax=Andrographis paniculata TaxID=175694 RepID=UPI0021E7358F|nr:protein CANDIDATE G-PROTEIN COUPLED RECEPTOR 7-like [Andrographis paniculata]
MHENLHHHLLCFLFLFFFNSLAVNSEIQTIKISSDSRRFIPLQDFGFGNEGFISISVSSVSIISTTTSKPIRNPVKLSLIGCFYAPTPARQAMKIALIKDICLIGKPFIFPVFTFDDKIISSKSHFRTSVPVAIPDLYYIFFVNCANNASVSATLDLKTYNVQPNGDPDYTDEQFSPLPTILYIYSMFHFGFILTWSHVCYKSKLVVQKIHIMMAVLLLLRFLELLSHASSQHSIKHSGSAHGWDVFWLTMYVLRSILFVVVIMLLGSAWSLFKPSLQELKKYTMAITILLQIVACICFILIRVIGQSNEKYRHWIVAYYATDFLCNIMMMVPVHTSIYILDVKFMEGKEPRRGVQKMAFENFAAALYVYVGFTRLVLFVFRTITSYKFWCLSIAMELVVELIFYILIYLLFWPNDRYDYAVVLEDRKEEINSAAAFPESFDFDLRGRFLLRYLF